MSDDEVDTFVVDTPTMPRTITGDLRSQLEQAERRAVAAGISQKVAEEARDRAEESLKIVGERAQRTAVLANDNYASLVEARADVYKLWRTLGDVLQLLDPGEFRSPERQATIRAAQDLHAQWKETP